MRIEREKYDKGLTRWVSGEYAGLRFDAEVFDGPQPDGIRADCFPAAENVTILRIYDLHGKLAWMFTGSGGEADGSDTCYRGQAIEILYGLINEFPIAA